MDVSSSESFLRCSEWMRISQLFAKDGNEFGFELLRDDEVVP